MVLKRRQWSIKSRSGFVFLLVTMATTASWQEESLIGLGWAAETEKPRGFPVGGTFRAHPFIQVSTLWEDNLYKTTNDPQTDEVLLIKPGIRIIKKGKKKKLSLSTELEAETYRQNKKEDNLGYKLNLDYETEPNKRIKLKTGYEYMLEHEERGMPLEGASVTSLGPNGWNQHLVKLSTGYIYNRLRSDLDLSHAIRKSDNNDQFVMDRYWDDASLTVKWAFLPKTGILMETGWKGLTYANQPQQDSTETRFLIGATWKITGKTTGTLKFGTTTKEFAIGTPPPATEITWTTESEWLPQKRTKLRMVAERHFQEGLTGVSVLTNNKLNLEHNLLPRLSLLTGIEWNTSDFGNSTKDEYWKTKFGFKHEFPRWFTLEANYFRNSKKSEPAGSDYLSNGLMMTLNGSL